MTPNPNGNHNNMGIPRTSIHDNHHYQRNNNRDNIPGISSFGYRGTEIPQLSSYNRNLHPPPPPPSTITGSHIFSPSNIPPGAGSSKSPEYHGTKDGMMSSGSSENHLTGSPADHIVPLKSDKNDSENDESFAKRHHSDNKSVRRRATTACTSCRSKKVKCDNNKPTCGTCARAGLVCNYADHQRKPQDSDSNGQILSKLDRLLEDMEMLKQNSATKPAPVCNTFSSLNKGDVSVISLFDWNYYKDSAAAVGGVTSIDKLALLKAYNDDTSFNYKSKSFKETLLDVDAIESMVLQAFPQWVNSFLVNTHMKLPVMNILELLEIIEMLQFLKSYKPDITFFQLVEHHSDLLDSMSDLYFECLQFNSIEDVTYRRKAWNELCQFVPIILVICALGILSTSVQLDNFTRFSSSLEERSFLSDALDENVIELLPDSIPKDRVAIAYQLITYSKLIINTFPVLIQEYTPKSCLYNIFLYQFYCNLLKPSLAYHHINIACRDIMYYLATLRNSDGDYVYEDPNHEDFIEKLYWVCYLHEGENRLELGPDFYPSGITQITPPTPFPRLPFTALNEPPPEGVENHSKECLNLAYNYDDQYTWYYFLTEVAVRKLENQMFNEIYCQGNSLAHENWDDPKFYNETVWLTFIRYLNQYDGIINSLSPRIRSFISHEVNIEQVYKVVFSNHKKKDAKNNISESISDSLEAYNINEELLVQAQSQSIIFMKTRILGSKMLLFRPIVYLFLEDRVSLYDTCLVVLDVINYENTKISNRSVFDASLPESRSDHLDYDNLTHQNTSFQMRGEDEDFAKYYASGENNEVVLDDSLFKLELLPEAKKKIIRHCILNLLHMPKMNLPNIGAHRRSGLWYYFRNLLVGNLYLVLLYRKLLTTFHIADKDPKTKMLLERDPLLNSFTNFADLIEFILPKKILIVSLEYTIVTYDYWKEEARDCTFYIQIIEGFLKWLKS